MIISCESCGTRFLVSASAIGPEGRMVRCANCGHRWRARPPEPEELPGPEVIDPAVDVQRPRPIPSGSRLPVPHRADAPGGVKFLAVACLLACIPLALIAFRDQIMRHAPFVEPVYGLLGLQDSSSIVIETAEVRSLPSRKMPKFLIEGIFANTGEEPKHTPSIRISLRNAANEELQNFTFHPETDEVMMPPGSKRPFQQRIQYRGKGEIAFFLIDAGSSLQLMVRR